MRKVFLFTSILLLSAVWAVAQYQGQSNQGGMSDQTSSEMGTSTTIEGCLSGSNGNYTLTDQSGTKYQLAGDTAKLQHHVGHTIQATGTIASTAETGKAGSMSEPSGGKQTFNVTSFKHISATCGGAMH